MTEQTKERTHTGHANKQKKKEQQDKIKKERTQEGTKHNRNKTK